MSQNNKSANNKVSEKSKICTFGDLPDGAGCTLFECQRVHKDRQICNMLCCKAQGYCFNGDRCLKKHVSIVEFACKNGINCPYKKCKDAHPRCDHDDFCTKPECLEFDFLTSNGTKQETKQETKKVEVKEVKEEKKVEKKEKSEVSNKQKVPEKQSVSVSNSFSILEDIDFPPVSSKTPSSNTPNLPKSFSQAVGKNIRSGSKKKQPSKVPQHSTPKLPTPVSSVNVVPPPVEPSSIGKEYTVVVDTISSKILIKNLPESKLKARLHVGKEILGKSKLEWNLTFKDDVIEVVPKSELDKLPLRKESVPLKLKDGNDTITEIMSIDLPNDYDDILVRMHAISNWLKVNNYSDECVSSYDSKNNTANATLI